MTVNKLTYPAKENAVQEKINEIIDNFPTSTTVDQTFDGTSANAQSGVAINGELTSNYQTKLVSGTNIKTINNTSLLGSGNISVLQNTATGTGCLTIVGNPSTSNNAMNIGTNSTASGGASIAIGRSANSKNTGSIAIGHSAVTSANYAIQIGFGTNSVASTLSVGFNASTESARTNWTLLDGLTGLIPDARISSNIARTSQIPTVPTKISDLTDDTATYPIDKADTLTNLTATVTELNYCDGVTSDIQTQLDGKVSKSGDTMTGNLTMYGIGYDPATNTINDSIFLKSSTIDINTVPSGEYNQFSPHLQMLDKNGALLAQIFYRHGTNGTRRLSFGCFNGQDTDSSYAYIGFDADGNRVCSFPNTTCVDGQVVDSLQTILSNGTSLNGSTNLTKRIDVPNDGHIYEVIIRGGVSTGSSSGNYVHLNVLGNQDSYSRGICACRTRTASSVGAAGSCIVYVSYVKTGATNITIERNTSYNGTISNLQTVSYRRVGTNS